MCTQELKIGTIPAVLYGKPAPNIWLFVHGQGGNKTEAAHLRRLPPQPAGRCWALTCRNMETARGKLTLLPGRWCRSCKRCWPICSSTGRWFGCGPTASGPIFPCMLFAGATIEKALFVSPIVDMERLICDMMQWAKVTPEQLCEKGEITTEFGQTLSWRYLCWVRQHPLDGWQIPTAILYAGQDTMTSRDTVTTFAQKHHAELTVYEPGEHWFHTPAQLEAMQTWERAHR